MAPFLFGQSSAAVCGRAAFLLLAALLCIAPAMAQNTSDKLPRVLVSPDKKGFVLEGSGERFTPWGFNYLGRFEHLAEEEWNTEEGWKRIERDFAEMKRLGANVVRWHLQLETYLEGPDRAREESLERLRRLLTVARAQGLYLDLTGLSCYRLARSPSWYDALSEEERWRTQAFFWEVISKSCAGDEAVFCYDLMNEPIITEAKEGEHPWLTGELGGFHFVQRICNKPAGRDTKEIAAAWVKQMTASIRRHDPKSLITVGVIPWAFVWPKAAPIFYSQEALPHLDFVSIHVYPKSGRLEPDLEALASYDLGKPLVVEEIFPLTCSVKELDEFIDGGKEHVDGWISHYFGYSAAEHREEKSIAGAIKAAALEYWEKKGKDFRNAGRE